MRSGSCEGDSVTVVVSADVSDDDGHSCEELGSTCEVSGTLDSVEVWTEGACW